MSSYLIFGEFLYLSRPSRANRLKLEKYARNASGNSSSARPLPPGQPRGICLRCRTRGWGIRNFIAARGLGIWHTCFRWVHRERRDVCRTMACSSGTRQTCRCFLRYVFSILDISSFNTCKHINKSNNVNYILFITKQSLTWTRLFRISHSKLA